MKKTSRNKFLKISCPRCNNKQIIFGKSSSMTKCIKCGLMLIKLTGGKIKIRAKVEQILWN